MDIYEVNAFSDDEEVARRPRIIRPRPNFFEKYDEKDFFDRFRLTPRTAERIMEDISGLIEHPTDRSVFIKILDTFSNYLIYFRNDCLSPSDQVLLTLNFYGNGSFLRTSSDLSGVSKSTASRVVRKVSVGLASRAPHHIQMPQNEEIFVVRQAFYDIAKFPRCIGAIDGTHIKIQSPGGENAEIFRNRKQYFSINVQTVADPNLKIRNIVAR